MNTYSKSLILLLAVTIFLLPACSGTTAPGLAEPGQATVVFIYTDG
jgi:outer membrane biogenesis lipoprotein LolB